MNVFINMHGYQQSFPVTSLHKPSIRKWNYTLKIFLLHWSIHNWWISLFRAQDKHRTQLLIIYWFIKFSITWKFETWFHLVIHYITFIYCLFAEHYERIWKVLNFNFLCCIYYTLREMWLQPAAKCIPSHGY